jgi:hypothetical protein
MVLFSPDRSTYSVLSHDGLRYLRIASAPAFTARTMFW